MIDYIIVNNIFNKLKIICKKGNNMELEKLDVITQ